MNLDTAGAIGEIVEAIAVVVTLVYLAVQTRHNAASTKSAVEIEASRQLSSWVSRVSHDDDLQRIWDEVQQGKILSTQDHRKFLWLMAELFHMSEGIYIQYQKGFLSDEVWGEFQRTMHGFLQVPQTMKWWRGGNAPLSSEFREYVEKLLLSEPAWQLPHVAGTEQK